jgi:DnaJ-class molecular chaperone
MSLYDTLGVNKDASQDDIKSAYKEKAKECHEDAGGDHESMVELNKAYGILKDPVKRDKYDKTGETESQSFEARFQQYVQTIFMSLVDNHDADYTDLIGEFKAYTEMIIEDNGKRVKDAEKRLKKLEKVFKRVSAKSENRIGMVLQNNMDNVKLEIGIIEENIKFMGECLLCLENYSYQVDEQPVQTYTYEWPLKASDLNGIWRAER